MIDCKHAVQFSWRTVPLTMKAHDNKAMTALLNIDPST